MQCNYPFGFFVAHLQNGVLLKTVVILRHGLGGDPDWVIEQELFSWLDQVIEGLHGRDPQPDGKEILSLQSAKHALMPVGPLTRLRAGRVMRLLDGEGGSESENIAEQVHGRQRGLSALDQ